MKIICACGKPLTRHARRGVCSTCRTAQHRARRAEADGPDMLLLPDDGFTDEIAISIAVNGERPVRLTQTERLIAGAALYSRGESSGEIAHRLGIPHRKAYSLIRTIQRRAVREKSRG